MLSRFDRISERDRQTDGQNCYINVARQRAAVTRRSTEYEHSNIWPCVTYNEGRCLDDCSQRLHSVGGIMGTR